MDLTCRTVPFVSDLPKVRGKRLSRPERVVSGSVGLVSVTETGVLFTSIRGPETSTRIDFVGLLTVRPEVEVTRHHESRDGRRN